MQRIRYSRYFRSLFIIVDITVISAVFIYFFISADSDFFAADTWDQNFLSVALLIFYWVLLSSRTKLYSIARNITYTIYLERLVTHIFLFIFGVILLGKVSNNTFLNQDRFNIGAGLFIFLFFIKSLIFFALKYIRTLGWNYRNIMFLTNDASTEILKGILKERKDYGFKVYDFEFKENLSLPNLVTFWKEHGIHTMYISLQNNQFSAEDQTQIYTLADKHQVRISLIPSVLKNNFFQYDLSYIETQPIMVRAKFPLDYLTNKVLKRLFDILFSAVILLFICSWLFPLIALLIKIMQKGPVLFIQQRYGYHDQVFNCYKFCTMSASEFDTIQSPEENESRITKVGKFLRKSSLDELPQFWNVLKGDMSIVGPRPHMLLVDNYYKLKIGRYAIRSLVKPGITGLAQVNGLRGERENMYLEMQKRVLADAFYVKNWTVSLDLVIIVKTVFLILGGDKNAK